MSPKKQIAAATAVEPHGYHFGGPWGTGAISVLLPLLVYAFTFACNDVSGCPAPSLLSPKTLKLEKLKEEVGWPEEGFWGLGSVNVTLAVLGYYLVNLVLYRFVPATEVDGVQLSSGGKLKYKFNTFASHMIITVVLIAGTIAQGADWAFWVYITDNYVQIVTANMFIAFALSTFVYVRSFSVKAGNKENRELAEGGHSGNLVYDWFIGRELNPRVEIPIIGEVDIKSWMELRPGLLGWSILNFAFVAKQYRTFGFVSNSIAFISVIQFVYTVDSWWNEPAILTTIDIIQDGFGFMLAFGDVAWLPFIYSQQTRYLSMYPLQLSALEFTAIGILIAGAFTMFRASNSQKNNFRTNPNDPRVAHLSYIETKTGSRLITSGWWGIARHINYLADWLQAWPYSLPTGFAGYQILAAGTGLADAHVEGVFKTLDGREVFQGAARGWGVPITYFYVLYFAVLLIHRDSRDDEKCARKYGEDWEKYKKIVRWRILPGVY